jgi:transposase
MGRALSRDLRDRVVAAVEGGVSCRRAAERFGVSPASAIRWRQLAVLHGTPAAKPQGGDRRSIRIEDHAAFILEAIEQQPDPTLAELREMLAARGVSVSIATLWRFFARHGITRKNVWPAPSARVMLGQRAGLHQRIRSQGMSPGQDGFRALRAS